MRALAERGWSPTIICESAGTQAEDALTTVSYTHLDVYKRQVLLRLKPRNRKVAGFLSSLPERPAGAVRTVCSSFAGGYSRISVSRSETWG